MNNILFVNACVRSQSRTYQLAQEVLAHLPGTVTQLRLDQQPLTPLTEPNLAQRGKAQAEGDFSGPQFQLARQFAEADTIVLAAPYWDLSFPAAVKLYFESVTVNGLTFRYGENGVPQGLCRAKRLIYVTTAGGPIGSLNLGFHYVDALAKGLLGIHQTHCFQAENLDIVGADVPAILSAAKEHIRSRVKELEGC